MRAMIGCLLGWVALACGSAGAPREILDTDKTTMRASLDSFTAYVVTHRDSMAAAMYAEKATFMPPNQSMVQGRAAIRAWIKTVPPAAADAELKHCYEAVYALYPEEYCAEVAAVRRPDGSADSIVEAHSLLPQALRHALSAYGVAARQAVPALINAHPLGWAGSLDAADQTFAETYAKEFYGRRGESEALWVVPREAIVEVEDFVDELNRNYHRVDGYSLKEKLKEARERAGRALVARDR